MKIRVVRKAKCSVCGATKESFELTMKILGFLQIKRYICQSCVARYFRKFRREVDIQ